MPPTFPRLSPVLLAALTCLVPATASAQSGGQGAGAVDVRGDVTAGSDVEQYLRMLQLMGKAPLQPWTLRAFSASEIEARAPADTTSHPWEAHYGFPAASDANFSLDWIRPRTRTIYNTAFPQGGNDGAIWAGRGATFAAQAGFRVRAGPVHVTVDPLAFWAENREFELAENGLGAEEVFSDPRSPRRIDAPQRFGTEGYGRVDLGNSEISVDAPGSRFYLSGAAEQWGPGERYPLMIGNNAGGFPHVGLATRGPLDLWAVQLNARYIVGKVAQSDLSPVTEGELDRLLVGLGISMTPRGVPGLELGLTRFVWSRWPEGGPGRDNLGRVFSSGLVHSLDNPVFEQQDNQLASFFLRWAHPDAGFEAYGEFSKEDFNLDYRHALLEPDDLAGYMLGLRKVIVSPADIVWQLSGELVNTEVSHQERGQRRVRSATPIPPYRHSGVPQGHTNRGQLLASREGYGGAGLFLRLDRFDDRGRWSGEFFRSFRLDWRRGLPGTSEDPDVIYGLAVEHSRFVGGSQLTVALAPSLNLNRNLDPANDTFNLRLEIDFRPRIPLGRAER